jgi:hypothetical protein
MGRNSLGHQAVDVSAHFVEELIAAELSSVRRDLGRVAFHICQAAD